MWADLSVAQLDRLGTWTPRPGLRVTGRTPADLEQLKQPCGKGERRDHGEVEHGRRRSGLPSRAGAAATLLLAAGAAGAQTTEVGRDRRGLPDPLRSQVRERAIPAAARADLRVGKVTGPCPYASGERRAGPSTTATWSTTPNETLEEFRASASPKWEHFFSGRAPDRSLAARVRPSSCSATRSACQTADVDPRGGRLAGSTVVVPLRDPGRRFPAEPRRNRIPAGRLRATRRIGPGMIDARQSALAAGVLVAPGLRAPLS